MLQLMISSRPTFMNSAYSYLVNLSQSIFLFLNEHTLTGIISTERSEVLHKYSKFISPILI